VAHTFFEIDKSCTFDALYIQPIVFAVREKCLEQLQLMIDIKTEGESTLNEIIRLLVRYPDVFNDRSPVQLVISGNRPAPSVWRNYPRFIRFDGRPYENYTDEQWEYIAVVSDNFNRYAGWLTHSIDMPIAAKLKSVIDAVHRRGKKIRFWKTPDNEWAWENLLNLGVDFINTDKPQQLKSFFDKKTSLTTTYISAYYEHNNKRLFK
jgi:alkaline phosphatase